MKRVMKTIQKSLTEFKSALRLTQEPVIIHDNENNFSREVPLNGLVEEENNINSFFGAEISKLQNVINQMDETTLNIGSTRRLCTQS